MCTSRGWIRTWIVFENTEIDKVIAWCFAENGLLWGVCVIPWHFKIVSSASTQARRSHRVSVMRPWQWPCWPWSPELGRVTENLCWGCERLNGPLERMQGEELQCEVWVNNAFSQLTFRRSEIGHSHQVSSDYQAIDFLWVTSQRVLLPRKKLKRKIPQKKTCICQDRFQVVITTTIITPPGADSGQTAK